MTPPTSSSLLFRIGHRAAAHPWRTITVWIAAAVVVVWAGSAIGGTLQDHYTIPGVDSQVVGVSDPFDPDAPSVSADGTTAIAGIAYDGPVTDVDPDEATATLERAVSDAEAVGYRVEFGGEVPENTTPPSSGSEAIGLLVGAVVLVVAFGSLLAMGHPIVIALASLGIGMSGIFLLAGMMDVSTITPTIAAMVGLGVGIDYALFVVTRHRERLAAGDEVVTATATATAGPADHPIDAPVLVAAATDGR